MLYEFKGSNGKVELYENKLVIKRNAVSGLARGSKEIYLKNITGIQIKKTGLTAGYIQFIFMGSEENKHHGAMKSVYDENTIMFQPFAHKKAIMLKQKIEELINTPNQQTINTQVISQADELKKFKELLDMGAITQEEFDAKKKELLNI